MKNTLQDLTIADLKALKDCIGDRIKTNKPTNEVEAYFHKAYYEIKVELNKRVELIFGKQ